MYTTSINQKVKYTLINLYEKAGVAQVIASMLGNEGYNVCLYENGQVPATITSHGTSIQQRLDGLGFLRLVRQSISPNAPVAVCLHTISH